MRHIYLVFIISLIFINAVSAENQTCNNSADKILERLQQNPAEVLQLPDKGTSVSAELASKGIQIRDDRLRESITEYCVKIERAHPTHTQYKTRSSNYTLLEMLVDLFEKKGENTTFAGDILELYHPTDLNRHADSIRAYVASRPIRHVEPDTLSVYAVLPSNNPNDVKGFINKVLNNQEYKSRYEDGINPITFGILARYGDRRAEDELIKYTQTSGKGKMRGHTEVVLLEDALVLASTSRVKKMLAEGLRSTDIIATYGLGRTIREEMYARALNRIFRDDPTYPFPNKRFLSWKEVGVLEQWCVKHLGIKVSTPFPDEPAPLDMGTVPRPQN